MTALSTILVGLIATALFGVSLGCGAGAVRSALRGEAIETGLSLVLALAYGIGFLVFAHLLGLAP